VETCTTAAAGTQRDADEGARVDRLFVGSCCAMSEADLRDVVSSMGRHSGPIYRWCREQAAGILLIRFGVREDQAEWDQERDAQAAWAEGQAEGVRAETDV